MRAETPQPKPEHPGKVMQTARESINRAIMAGELENDPLRFPLIAMRDVLDAVESACERIETVPATVLLSQDAQTRIVTDGTRFIKHEFSRVFPWFASLIRTGATIGLVVGAVIAFGAGYFAGAWRSDTEQLLATCRGGQVQTTQDGRRYCSVWLDPAPVAKPR